MRCFVHGFAPTTPPTPSLLTHRKRHTSIGHLKPGTRKETNCHGAQSKGGKQRDWECPGPAQRVHGAFHCEEHHKRRLTPVHCSEGMGNKLGNGAKAPLRLAKGGDIAGSENAQVSESSGHKGNRAEVSPAGSGVVSGLRVVCSLGVSRPSGGSGRLANAGRSAGIKFLEVLLVGVLLGGSFGKLAQESARLWCLSLSPVWMVRQHACQCPCDAADLYGWMCFNVSAAPLQLVIQVGPSSAGSQG